MIKRGIRPGFHDKLISGKSYTEWLDLTKYVHDVINANGYPVFNDCCIAAPSLTDVGKVLTIGEDGKIAIATVAGVGGSVNAVNLGTATATYQQIQVVGGTNFNLPLGTSALAGLLSPAQFNKLSFLTVTQSVDLDTIESNVGNLITLSGVSANATTLGTFTGATIVDNSTIKVALQALETTLETNDTNAVHKAGAETITGVKTFSVQPIGITGASIVNTPAGNIAATTVQAAITELDNEKQAKIAFYEEGTIVGTSGGYTKVNFIGGTVTAAQNGSDATQLDVTITSSGGGSTLGRVQLAGTGTTAGTKLDVKYDILSGTPVLSYTIASGIGTLSVTGGTVNYRKLQADINTSTDVDGSGFFTLVVNNLPTSTMFEYPFAQLIDTKAGVAPSTTAYQYKNSGSAPIMNITSATAGSSITIKPQSEIVTTFGASAKAVSMIVVFG